MVLFEQIPFSFEDRSASTFKSAIYFTYYSSIDTNYTLQGTVSMNISLDYMNKILSTEICSFKAQKM